MKKYDELMQVKERFDLQYKKHEYIYLYVAPKDQNLFNRFTAHAKEMPTLTGSMYEVLSDSTSVQSILKKKFPTDIVLEIYVATDDRSSAFGVQGTLKDYIKREHIDFEY